jgi:hypothetical protein
MRNSSEMFTLRHYLASWCGMNEQHLITSSSIAAAAAAATAKAV